MGANAVEYREYLCDLIVAQFEGGAEHVSAEELAGLYLGPQKGRPRYIPDAMVDDIARHLPLIRKALEELGYPCALVCREFFTEFVDKTTLPETPEEGRLCIAGEGGRMRASGISRNSMLYMAYLDRNTKRATSSMKQNRERGITASKKAGVSMDTIAVFLIKSLEEEQPASYGEFLTLLTNPELKTRLESLFPGNAIEGGEGEEG